MGLMVCDVERPLRVKGDGPEAVDQIGQVVTRRRSSKCSQSLALSQGFSFVVPEAGCFQRCLSSSASPLKILSSARVLLPLPSATDKRDNILATDSLACGPHMGCVPMSLRSSALLLPLPSLGGLPQPSPASPTPSSSSRAAFGVIGRKERTD